MKFSLVRRLAACAVLFFMTAGTLFASGSKSPTSGFAKMDTKEVMKNFDASADVFEYIGNNMILRGHVVIITKEMTIKADNAVIHRPTNDLEAFGNVSLVRRITTERAVDAEEYRDLLEDVRKNIEIQSISLNPLGKKKFNVKITETVAHIQAERLAGNLNNGELRFQNFAMKSGGLHALAELANRKPSGEIIADRTRMTTCDYVMDDHDHYAFTSSKAYITPRNYHTGLQNYNSDHSDHSILLVNSFLRFWNVPILWFPALYKPRETDSFGIDLTVGHDDDWGYWLRSSKNFDIYGDPYVNVGLMMDYYSDRGFGGGLTATIVTGNSRTEIFGYAIKDRNPYLFRGITHEDEIEEYELRRRLTIPKNRYDFKATNITHITPRLDFRGQVEFTSDIDFREDFFENRYNADPQPPTFAALEYQADWASFSVLATGKVNSFDSVIERLPEVRMDIFRQELFGGLYYQSENSVAYLSNKWRKFKRNSELFTQEELEAALAADKSESSDSTQAKPKKSDAEKVYDLWQTKKEERDKTTLKNYSSGRFDSLHMFYYPINLDYINIIPRAGFRLTAYTATSRNKVTDEDLNAMFGADSLFGNWTEVNNFDVSKNAKLRFMGEFGVEVNTKIYKTWQDVRSSWLNLDGLRHIIVPYLNYTFIPEPSLDSENILYFDEVDRLKEQHFIRFGLINKLQTRGGDYGSEQIREWASLETYWDFHAHKQEGFGHAGDLGVKLSLTPTENLTIEASAVFDIDGNSKEDYSITRSEDDVVVRPGLGKLKFLNELNASIRYNIAKDLYIKAAYYYSSRYWRRSVYSMGSMLESTNATSTSLKVLETPTQSANLTIGFPSYFDKHLKGEVYLVYDINQALLEDAGISLVRDFHCFRVGLNLGMEMDRNNDGKKETSFHISGYVGLTAMPSMKLGTRK